MRSPSAILDLYNSNNSTFCLLVNSTSCVSKNKYWYTYSPDSNLFIPKLINTLRNSFSNLSRLTKGSYKKDFESSCISERDSPVSGSELFGFDNSCFFFILSFIKILFTSELRIDKGTSIFLLVS